MIKPDGDVCMCGVIYVFISPPESTGCKTYTPGFPVLMDSNTAADGVVNGMDPSDPNPLSGSNGQ